MIPLLFLLAVHVVAVKVFKKTSPNGKLTVYLGSRDFVDRLDGNVDPIEGLLVVDEEYIKERRVYGQVSTTFRYGREEDEVMGLRFSKEMILVKEQVVPSKKSNNELSPLQEKLIKKLGESSNIFPFSFRVSDSAPGESDTGKPLGVEYELKAFVADNDQGFTLSPGKITLNVTLNRGIYYHQEEVQAQVQISNTSKKSVKNIKVQIIQSVEITMVNAHFTRQVAHLETREGCPLTPGASLTKVFNLNPAASNNKDKRGIALDGHLKDEDVNLASSTFVTGNPNDALGFLVSYAVRVKLNLGTLGGEITADLPFRLVHPGPEGLEPAKESNKMKNGDRSKYEKQCYAKDADEDENIIFEDFAKLRMSMSEIDN